MQKTQNGSGSQVVADLHFMNSSINEKLFGKSKQLVHTTSSIAWSALLNNCKSVEYKKSWQTGQIIRTLADRKKNYSDWRSATSVLKLIYCYWNREIRAIKTFELNWIKLLKRIVLNWIELNWKDELTWLNWSSQLSCFVCVKERQESSFHWKMYTQVD